MVVTDPIGDMITRIRNAIGARFDCVEMPSSKIKAQIAQLLKDDGFINNHEVLTKGAKKILRIQLKYRSNKKNAINNLRRVSSPARHMYVKSSKIPRVQSGFGTAVISTSKGLMTDRFAREQKIGGEVLFYVW